MHGAADRVGVEGRAQSATNVNDGYGKKEELTVPANHLKKET